MNKTIQNIKTKYSKFFEALEKAKEDNEDIEYEINQNGSIVIFCNGEVKDKKGLSTIHLIDSEIDCIPSNTTFHSNVGILDNNSLKTIGEKVTIYGELNIIHCNNLESIGEKLSANFLFILGCNKLKELPNNIKIKDEIILENSNIQKFLGNIKAQSLGISKPKYNNIFIKNIENLEIEKLIIYDSTRLKNINKVKGLKTIIFYQPLYQTISKEERKKLINSSPSLEKSKNIEKYDKIILDHEMTEKFLKTIRELGYIDIYYNYLDFKSPNSFCSKLINEEYDLITEEEIEKYSNIKEFLIGENKIPVSITDYCVGLKGALYLKNIIN